MKTPTTRQTANDFTNPVIYVITSASGESALWTVKLQSNNLRIGLGSLVTEERRLVRNYEWYIGQESIAHLAKVNGGAACIAMTMKWVDAAKYFNPDLKEIRDVSIAKIVPFPPGTPPDPNYLFTPECVSYYFTQHNIFFKLITLTTDPKDITEHIDRGNLVVILPDFSCGWCFHHTAT